MLFLKKELRYYHFVSQAELTIDGVDDKEEHRLTEVIFLHNYFYNKSFYQKYTPCK